MKYYIIAGEASGDLHGSKLVKAIRQNDGQSNIRAWGGDLMQKEGATLVKHYRELAFMGFLEVLLNIKTILANLKFCKKDILAYQPDVVVFIDYPGFNIPVSKFAKKNNFKTVYYISPQIWAWKEKRVFKIKKYIDKMLVILPFEKAFYQKWNYDVEYVGHPLIETIEAFKTSEYTKAFTDSFKKSHSKKTVAILPGSRKQEIKKKLPIMLEATRKFNDVSFIIAQAPGIEDQYIHEFIAGYANITVWKNKTYELLSIADAAMVTSGTATLETALFGVPEAVCYKTSWISFAIAKYFIKVPFISLVNIILNKAVVAELIQEQLTAENLTEKLNQLLYDEQGIRQMKNDFEDLKKNLLPGGNASEKAAAAIKRFLQISN